MVNAMSEASQTIELSRDELLFVLNSLQSDTILGLDQDLVGELTSDGRDIALTVAARSLRARTLVQAQPDDSIALHTDLLNAVGTCAHAQRALILLHWAEPGDRPERFFAHSRDSIYVSHTQPDDILHLFSLYPTKPDLVSHSLAFCQVRNGKEIPEYTFSLNRVHFDQVSDLAGNGKEDAAISLLAEQSEIEGAKHKIDEIARYLIRAFGNPVRMTLIQSIKPDQGGVPEQMDLMLIHDDTVLWMISTPRRNDDEQHLAEQIFKIEMVSRNKVAERLIEWL